MSRSRTSAFATAFRKEVNVCYQTLKSCIKLLHETCDVNAPFATKFSFEAHVNRSCAMMWLGRTDPSNRGRKIEPQTALRTTLESSRRILKQLLRQNAEIFATKKSCVANFWYQFWAETGLAQNLVPNRRSRIQTKHMETRNLHVAKFFYTTACLELYSRYKCSLARFS